MDRKCVIALLPMNMTRASNDDDDDESSGGRDAKRAKYDSLGKQPHDDAVKSRKPRTLFPGPEPIVLNDRFGLNKEAFRFAYGGASKTDFPPEEELARVLRGPTWCKPSHSMLEFYSFIYRHGK